MDYLDEGVLTEILLRLPAKSLLRFKCVSRLWHSLITDPEFRKDQLRMSLEGNPNPSEKLLVPVHDKRVGVLNESIFTVLSNPPIKLSEHVPIRGSCHGLVCLQGTDRRQFFVCNPTTRELRQLPISGSYPDWMKHTFFVCGFGYDTLKADYKLLLIPRFGTTGIAEIYSLRSNSWRSISGVNYYHLQGLGRYSDGFLHWLSRESQGYTIVSFDVATEEFREALLPMPSFRLQCGYVELNVTGGGTLIVYSTKWPRIEVWIMKDRGLNSTWTELCCFSIEPLMKDESPWPVQDRISPLIKGGIILLCVKQERNSLGIYDPKDGSLKTCGYDISYISTYVESLVSVRVAN